MSLGQNITGQNAITKCHRKNVKWQSVIGIEFHHMTKFHTGKMSQHKMSLDKISHRQNVTGQNVAEKMGQTKCHRTKCQTINHRRKYHMDKMSQSKLSVSCMEVGEISALHVKIEHQQQAPTANTNGWTISKFTRFEIFHDRRNLMPIWHSLFVIVIRIVVEKM